MRLLIISHTPHYLREGRVVGWGATVLEIDQLATLFESVVHIAPLQEGPAPRSSLSYQSPRVRFRAVAPAGGVRFRDKLLIPFRYPGSVRAILEERRQSDEAVAARTIPALVDGECAGLREITVELEVLLQQRHVEARQQVCDLLEAIACIAAAEFSRQTLHVEREHADIGRARRRRLDRRCSRTVASLLGRDERLVLDDLARPHATGDGRGKSHHCNPVQRT